MCVAGYDNVFTIGDIAKTDDNRSSARNAGHLILAHNVKAYLEGRSERMKPFKPPRYRWGSIWGFRKRLVDIYAQWRACRDFTLVGQKPFFSVCLRLIYQGLEKRR